MNVTVAMDRYRTYDVDVVLPSSSRQYHWTEDESEAVRLAEEWVGPKQPQITVTAHANIPGTFAVRHFTWKNGAIEDSGWRHWEEGAFIGGTAPRQP